MKRFASCPAILLAAILIANGSPAEELPRFEPQTIDSQVAIGYGTVIDDVDGDGKPDILLADKKQFVWYRNPDWKRFVIVENLTEEDNVCMAARDLDGDGKVEIAVGAQWNPGDTVNSGSVHYLIAPADRTQKWTPVKLHHEPVVHRMRWVSLGYDSLRNKKFALVVAPLHGRSNEGGKGAGVKLLAYHMPENLRDEWRTELLDDTLHVTHNFDRGQWGVPQSGPGSPEEIIHYGREGAIAIYTHGDEDWHKRILPGISGGGEIRMGQLANKKEFLATVEPFHGSSLVLYRYGAADGPSRTVLDDDLNQGHAVATADLLGTGGDQVVVGWRGPNSEGHVGVKLHYPTDEAGTAWKSVWVDQDKMACEDLRVGDLDGDGRLDIVAAGRGTHNLNVYWNRKP